MTTSEILALQRKGMKPEEIIALGRSQQKVPQQQSQPKTPIQMFDLQKAGLDGDGILPSIGRGLINTSQRMVQGVNFVDDLLGNHVISDDMARKSVAVTDALAQKKEAIANKGITNERRVEKRRLDAEVENARGFSENVIAGAKKGLDVLTTPSEWTAQGVTELISPENLLGLGTGAVVGKLATTFGKKIAYGAMGGAVEGGVLGAGVEYAVAKGGLKSDEEAIKIAQQSFGGGVAMGSVMGGVGGAVSSKLKAIEVGQTTPNETFTGETPNIQNGLLDTAAIKQKIQKGYGTVEPHEVDSVIQEDIGKNTLSKIQTFEDTENISRQKHEEELGLIRELIAQGSSLDEIKTKVNEAYPLDKLEESFTLSINDGNLVDARFGGMRILSKLEKAIEFENIDPKDFYKMMRKAGYKEEVANVLRKSYEDGNTDTFLNYISENKKLLLEEENKQIRQSYETVSQKINTTNKIKTEALDSFIDKVVENDFVGIEPAQRDLIHALNDLGIVEELQAYDMRFENDTSGNYNPTTRTISMSTKEVGKAQILTHEYLHSATSHLMHNNEYFRNDVKDLMGEFKKSVEDTKEEYGFTNEYEFVAESFSNPEFAKKLNDTKLSENAKKMFGYTKESNPSLWDVIVEKFSLVVKEFTGMDFKINKESYFESLNNMVAKEMEALYKVAEEMKNSEPKTELEALLRHPKIDEILSYSDGILAKDKKYENTQIQKPYNYSDKNDVFDGSKMVSGEYEPNYKGMFELSKESVERIKDGRATEEDIAKLKNDIARYENDPVFGYEREGNPDILNQAIEFGKNTDENIKQKFEEYMSKPYFKKYGKVGAFAGREMNHPERVGLIDMFREAKGNIDTYIVYPFSNLKGLEEYKMVIRPKGMRHIENRNHTEISSSMIDSFLNGEFTQYELSKIDGNNLEFTKELNQGGKVYFIIEKLDGRKFLEFKTAYATKKGSMETDSQMRASEFTTFNDKIIPNQNENVNIKGENNDGIIGNQETNTADVEYRGENTDSGADGRASNNGDDGADTSLGGADVGVSIKDNGVDGQSTISDTITDVSKFDTDEVVGLKDGETFKSIKENYEYNTNPEVLYSRTTDTTIETTLQQKNLFERYDETIDNLFDGASRVVRGVDESGVVKDKKFSANPFVFGTQKFGEWLRTNFVTGGNMDENLVRSLEDFDNMKSNIKDEASNLRDSLSVIDKQKVTFNGEQTTNGALLTRALGGDLDPKELPQNLQGLHETLRRTLDEQTQMLVDAGELKPEFVKDNYLKRYYEKHLMRKSIFDGIGGYKLSGKHARADMDLETRKALGQVENAGFVIAKTLLEQRMQLEKATLLKSFADKYGKDSEAIGLVQVSKRTTDDGFTKVYGALAGKYVPEDIYNAVMDGYEANDTINQVGRFWVGLMDHIKVTMTVKNPGTHLYNMLSNVWIAGLDGHIKELGEVSMMAKNDKAMFDKLVSTASKYGLNGWTADLEGIHFKDTSTYSNPYVNLLNNIFMTEGSKVGDAFRSAYDWEDKIFKLAKFYSEMKKYGMNLDDPKATKMAYNEVNKIYVNHSSKMPKGVKVLDKSGISPFLGYVYRSTPQVARLVAKHPLKFVAMHGMLATVGASAIWNSITGEDEKLDELKADWMKSGGANMLGIESFIHTGKDENGNDGFLNAGRSAPGMRMMPEKGNPFLLYSDGGFLSTILGYMRGVNKYGGELYKEDDSDGVKTLKIASAMSEYVVPPLTPAIPIIPSDDVKVKFNKDGSINKRYLNKNGKVKQTDTVSIGGMYGQKLNQSLGGKVDRDGNPILPSDVVKQSVGLKTFKVDNNKTEKEKNRDKKKKEDELSELEYQKKLDKAKLEFDIGFDLNEDGGRSKKTDRFDIRL